MKSELVFIEHKNLSDSFFQIICEIKSSAWQYPNSMQKDWMEKNLNSNDIHILLKVDGEYVAYLNLIETNVFFNDNIPFSVKGIGNVCSKTKGLGHGKKLLELTSQYLSKNKIKTILLCKKHLIKFYSKFGFKLNFELKKDVFLMSTNFEDSNFIFQGNFF